MLERGPRLFGVPAIPLLALVAANLIPLAGVIFFGWDLGGVLLLYWAENVVVAVWAIIRMLVIGRAAAIPLIVFFTIHYGIFTFVHLIFVYSMTEAADWDAVQWNDGGFSAPNKPDAAFFPTRGFFAQLSPLAAVALFASHGVSFVRNFLKGGEWQRSSLTAEMGRPYPRMVVLHLAIIAGGFAIALLGQPAALLAVLVLLKIVLDAVAHVVEHRLAAARSNREATAHAGGAGAGG